MSFSLPCRCLRFRLIVWRILLTLASATGVEELKLIRALMAERRVRVLELVVG